MFYFLNITTLAYWKVTCNCVILYIFVFFSVHLLPASDLPPGGHGGSVGLCVRGASGRRASSQPQQYLPGELQDPSRQDQGHWWDASQRELLCHRDVSHVCVTVEFRDAMIFRPQQHFHHELWSFEILANF